MIIGVAGQARFGKDEISNFLAKKLDYARSAFANNVKNIFCDTFNVDLDFVEKWKVVSECPPGFDMTVRKSLQFIGDGFRKIKSDVWVELVFRDNPKKIVISDIRYCNELISIKKNKGINILLWRPNFENNDANESEAQIKKIIEWFSSQKVEGRVTDILKNDAPYGCEFVDYFIINNGTLDDFFNKVERYIIPNL
jgi:hypothetical protein